MSTPNFRSAENVLFVSESEESFDFDYTKEAVYSALCEVFGVGEIQKNDSVKDDNMSYFTRAFAVTMSSRMYGNREVAIYAYFTVCGGYYGGESWDVFLELDVDGETIYPEDRSTLSKSMLQGIDKKEKSIIEKTREAYKSVGLTELNRVAIFSNGEAIYNRV